MVRASDKNVIVSGRGPIVSVALGLVFSIAITYNALGRQDARHPAPIPAFWFEEMLDIPATEEADEAGLRRREGESEIAQDQELSPYDELVSQLQSELAAMSYYDGDIDGIMGPRTEAAIEAYEGDNGLRITGNPSDSLLEHAGYTRRIREALAETPSTSSVLNSDRVMLIQTGLAEMGYNPGPVDGRMGDQTRDAIRQFQRDRSMTVTGDITEALIDELRNVTGLSTLGGQQLG